MRVIQVFLSGVLTRHWGRLLLLIPSLFVAVITKKEAGDVTLRIALKGKPRDTAGRIEEGAARFRQDLVHVS